MLAYGLVAGRGLCELSQDQLRLLQVIFEPFSVKDHPLNPPCQPSAEGPHRQSQFNGRGRRR